jgi:hypothetical protein
LYDRDLLQYTPFEPGFPGAQRAAVLSSPIPLRGASRIPPPSVHLHLHEQLNDFVTRAVSTLHTGRHWGTQNKNQKPKMTEWRGWLVPRRPKKYQGWSDFFVRFFIVFFNTPHRETPKNVMKRIEKKTVLDFLSIFL